MMRCCMNVFNSISAGFDSIFRGFNTASFPSYRSASDDREALLRDFYAIQDDFRTGIRKVINNDNQNRCKKDRKVKR